MISTIRRLSLLAAFVAIGASAFAITEDTQIKVSRALNSPTLAVKYTGVHVALIELRLNGESYGTRTMDYAPESGETTFTLDMLALKDGDNNLEIRLYDKAGRLVGTEKTVIGTDSNTKSPVFLNSPKMGETVMGPVEISVGFGRDFKNVYVSFFIDSQFKSMMNFPPYNFTWDSTREANGWHELEAWVVDDTSATFKTRKLRVYVNNPGGRTYRTSPAVSKLSAAKSPPKSAVKPAVKPSKGIPVLPAPKPLDLETSANAVAPGLTGASSYKPLEPNTKASAVVTATPKSVAPAVGAFLTSNVVVAKLEGGATGLKPAELPESIASGARLMTPTGKRTILSKARVALTAPGPSTRAGAPPVTAATKGGAAKVPSQPSVSASNVSGLLTPEANLASVAPSQQLKVLAVTSPSKIEFNVPAAKAPSVRPLLAAVLPTPKPLAPAATVKPLRLAATGEGGSQMQTTPLQPKTLEPSEPKPLEPAPSRPAAAAPQAALAMSMASTEPIRKVAVKTPAPSRARLLRVEYGTKLPIRSTYSILFNGSALKFDVAPALEQGIPVTPFRHLIEKAGGEVNWDPADHEVQAETDGRSIWLKIGNKVAKINDLSVTLELAPFLKQGRTIVPLSFIKSALNVNIEYDKVTGHVLITPKIP